MVKESKYNQSLTFNNSRILYNAMTKACIYEGENKELLKNNLTANEIESLSKLGFLVGDDSVEESSILRYLFNKKYFNHAHFLNIVLVPGLECNFSCPYCFERVNNMDELFTTNLERYFSSLKSFAWKTFQS